MIIWNVFHICLAVMLIVMAEVLLCAGDTNTLKMVLTDNEAGKRASITGGVTALVLSGSILILLFLHVPFFDRVISETATAVLFATYGIFGVACGIQGIQEIRDYLGYVPLHGRRVGVLLIVLQCSLLIVLMNSLLTIPERVYVLVGTEKVGIAGSETDSVLRSKLTGNVYASELIHDEDLSTCWMDGAPGSGEGETLRFSLEEACLLVSFDLVNGRVISKEKYYANARMKEVLVSCYLEEKLVYSTQMEFQDFFYTKPVNYKLKEDDSAVECDRLELYVQSVYEGSRYEDLCVTEVVCYKGIYEEKIKGR